MKNKRRFGLMGQLNIVFTFVTLIISTLFVVIFNQTLNVTIKKQAEKDFIYFSEELSKTEKDDIVISEYYSYVVYYNNLDKNNIVVYREVPKDFVDSEEIKNFYITYFDLIISDSDNKIIKYNGLNYYYTKVSDNDIDYLIITIGDNEFENFLKEPINHIVLIGFVALIILGNAIILLSSNILVERIKNLKVEVSGLSASAYKSKINIVGNDEISDLAFEIEKMRKEIVTNENIKQEMLQNLSHDIKTPISVIKSYAEAIKDGISNINDINVIIKQTNVLTQKVFKLLEWNRLEYIRNKEDYYPVDINRMIKSIVKNYKYKKDIKFELQLDNSYLIGLDEYYYSMISNIVENALRYAKTKIVITLCNKKITIFNDGDPIDDKFLTSDFRPYQKGHKGQFGLGLSIVSKTAELFDLLVKVENNNNGVLFTIEPL